MRHLTTISILMTLLGIAAVATAAAFHLNLTFTVVGMLLIVAGVVKIVIVGLWNSVAGFGVPIDADAPATSTFEKERRR